MAPILYICADFGIPVLGHKGASVHVREMVRAFSDLGHDVVVVAARTGAGDRIAGRLVEVAAAQPDDLPARALHSVEKLCRRGSRPARAFHELREMRYNDCLARHLRRLAQVEHPLFIYERYSLLNTAGLDVAHQLGIPFVLEVNAPLVDERARVQGLVFRRAALRAEARLFGEADAVVAVSEQVADYVRQHGAAAQRVTVLPNAVDSHRFYPGVDGTAVRARYGLAADTIVIGFAGSLKPWHGASALVRAFDSVHSDVPNARLLIVGDGPAADDVRTTIESHGLGDLVVMTGSVPHAEMPAYLAAMDIAVAPYENSPSFYFSPLKIFEYLALGKPVVATRIGQIESIVQHGHNGCLFPAGSHAELTAYLRHLCVDPLLRQTMAQAAALSVANRTWQGNAQRAVDLAVHSSVPASPLPTLLERVS